MAPPYSGGAIAVFIRRNNFYLTFPSKCVIIFINLIGKVVRGMNQSVVFRSKKLFPGSDVVRKYRFKAMNTRDNCALLARANRQLSQKLALSRDKSALLAIICPIQTAVLDTTRGNFALFQKKDCFECLSPHNFAA